jgi:hypothetical protein
MPPDLIHCEDDGSTNIRILPRGFHLYASSSFILVLSGTSCIVDGASDETQT